MENYLISYQSLLESTKIFKKMIMDNVVVWIRAVGGKPIIIGNMVYWAIIMNGEDVPAYCYLSDYKNGGPFLPIYDENNTGLFGWSDFSECCRIFNEIRDTIQHG